MATATPVLLETDRHLLSRFSYGVTPALAAEATAAGGARAWLEQQLAVPTTDDGTADWFPDLHLDAATLWHNNVSGMRGGWQVMEDYGRRLLLRRMMSSRQLLEVMTEFWESSLHVPAVGDEQFTWRTDYGDVIRSHALGRFSDLLQATITHPAMTIFLGGWDSTKEHPNENLGRELLELHTVGVGHYTEDDVKSSARILTGYTIDMWQTFAASYDPARHWTGAVAVMDFSAANTAPDGRPLAAAYLDHLAHHPATARRIATRLATKFIGDTPPDSIVTTLAGVYLANDTAIAPVLRALVDSAEFAAAGPKLRTPTEDLVATYRLIGATIARPTASDSAANALLWVADDMGQLPSAWPRPDGDPLVDTAWATPSRVIGSLSLHVNAAGGWWPTLDVTYPGQATWLPQDPTTLADLVDHVARLIHQRPADATLLQAVQTDLHGAPATATVSSTHNLWWMPQVLWTVLDHPHHYVR